MSGPGSPPQLRHRACDVVFLVTLHLGAEGTEHRVPLVGDDTDHCVHQVMARHGFGSRDPERVLLINVVFAGLADHTEIRRDAGADHRSPIGESRMAA